MRTDRLLGEYRIYEDNAAGRRELENCVERRRADEAERNYDELRRGWFFGGNVLRRALLKEMRSEFKTDHEGRERWESAEEHAARLVAEELVRLDLREADLKQRRKGDAEKVRIARRLRKETTMTLKWIAERLQMGSVSMVKRGLLSRKGPGKTANYPD